MARKGRAGVGMRFILRQIHECLYSTTPTKHLGLRVRRREIHLTSQYLVLLGI